jgi:murein DD-endopeptidase MepM/ murein hydrolase activator NlpD
MRRSDPLTNQYSYTAVFVLLTVKVFVVLLVIVIGGSAFLKARADFLANPSGAPQTAANLPTAVPLVPPDTEWGKALSTQVQSQSLTLTPPVNAGPTLLPPTAAVQITPTATSPASPPPVISSPLMGISLEDLAGTISQVFAAPPTGEDSGHHGVDFAFWSRGEQASILGLPITSVFSGRVASAFTEIRPPYGYVTIIETPLSSLPQNLISAIKLPTMAAAAGKNDKLNCPTGFTDQWNTESQSIYLLYAHMNKPPAVALGQTVNAGDVIGEVGNTGASSAPHLHLEMRIGPSNATFESLGHYDPSTTDQERHNYCTWRISGVFQMFDPMTLLTVQ